MSCKKILLGTLFGVALTSCQASDKKEETKDQLTVLRKNVIIALVNETQFIITRVRVLRKYGVDDAGEFQYQEVANIKMQLRPKSTTIINTSTVTCALSVEVHYSEAPPETFINNYCNNMSLILKPKRTAIISVASV